MIMEPQNIKLEYKARTYSGQIILSTQNDSKYPTKNYKYDV